MRKLLCKMKIDGPNEASAGLLRVSVSRQPLCSSRLHSPPIVMTRLHVWMAPDHKLNCVCDQKNRVKLFVGRLQAFNGPTSHAAPLNGNPRKKLFYSSVSADMVHRLTIKVVGRHRTNHLQNWAAWVPNVYPFSLSLPFCHPTLHKTTFTITQIVHQAAMNLPLMVVASTKFVYSQYRALTSSAPPPRGSA